ncbi:MAG: electron transfer flavoprotein subunit alpha/FixB family protein [Solirubrobacteraceae bacterium]
MSVLTLVEHAGGEPDELSRQALTFARGLGEPVEAVLLGPGAEDAAGRLGAFGVSTACIADGFDAYAPAAMAQAMIELIGRRSPGFVLAPGTERGNEVLAHVAARTDQPMAANCISVTPGEPLRVTRVRWGGSLLEEAELHGSPALLTVAPHAVTVEPTSEAAVATEHFTPTLTEADLVARVLETVSTVSAGVSLTDADVVVSGGRGVGSPEGFAAIEELATLLSGAVGCSRAVTSAGWRPHTDQVGQTGSKISPEIYIACGISGATQHMAGCKGAKKVLAINPDGGASIFAGADYAVIGDLHEVVPAISAEVRKARGT